MPGQRRQDYALQKVLGREAANIGMTVVTSLVPPVMALPVTGALALYAAATRPEKFIENVASELPVSIAVSGLYAGFRGGSSLYERASVERVKSLLRNADSNVNKLQRIDFTSGIGLQALAEHIQEEQDDFERKAYKGRGDKVEQDVGKIADIVSRGRSEMTQVQNEEIDRALSTALKQLEQEKKKLEGSLTQKESELIKSMGKTQKGLLTECNAQIKRLRSYQKGGDNENQLVILGRQKTGARVLRHVS